ncbi:hypothetical protein BpHYR1_032486 [Brachionus plicatilis]|uniref:Uncharacterized protein n=1 Tax=Brachionus plicatilis TaxID=10195 RepID=A0A3M7QLR3_BRAPC|nr:hypothetical protein BpHYR1_032486 [Brachionus plicatilis]
MLGTVQTAIDAAKNFLNHEQDRLDGRLEFRDLLKRTSKNFSLNFLPLVLSDRQSGPPFKGWPYIWPYIWPSVFDLAGQLRGPNF